MDELKNDKNKQSIQRDIDEIRNYLELMKKCIYNIEAGFRK